MKAYTKYKYGGPEVLQLEEVDKPVVKDGHLVVKIFANSANPADWHMLRGEPFFARFADGLFKPKRKFFGCDFSGVVEEVGKNTALFKVGDRIFGESFEEGVFSEYARVSSSVCSYMPEGSGFAEMACVPIAGLTALQALTTHGKLKSGESVLINGSSGGVGHFAVQIAKAYGAEVTAVCSYSSVEFVKALGVDHVIAYDRENIHQHDRKYDLVLDIHGNLSHKDFTRMGHRGILVGFTTMGNMMSVLFKSIFSKFSLKLFIAKASTEDLETLAALIKDGKVKVQIEKTYPYEQIPEAIGYIESMHTKGKVAMVWESE